MRRYQVVVDMTWPAVKPVVGMVCQGETAKRLFRLKLPNAHNVMVETVFLRGFLLLVGTGCRYIIEFHHLPIALSEVEEAAMQAVNESFSSLDRAASTISARARELPMPGTFDLFLPSVLGSVASGFVVGTLFVVALRFFGRR